MKIKLTLITVIVICLSANAQWSNIPNSNFYSLTHHENRPSDFGLYLQPSGGNPSYFIENNTNGTNRQLFFFGHGNGNRNVFGISTSTNNGNNWISRFSVSQNGNVGIGTSNPENWKLAVNGNIRAKEIKVETGWSDFVFDNNYNLPTLEEVEKYIKQEGHLKDIPSAKEVEKNGIFLGEMDSKLLQKIEELILYTIAQEKKISSLEKENESIKLINLKLLELQKRMEKLENNNENR